VFFAIEMVLVGVIVFAEKKNWNKGDQYIVDAPVHDNQAVTSDKASSTAGDRKVSEA